MLTRDRMTANPVSIEPTATLGQALEKMAMNHIRALPVVENGAVIGILTDRDLKMALGPDSRHLTVDAIDPRQLEGNVDWFMTPGVVTVREDTPLAVAGHQILEMRVGALPVVNDEGALTGILSATDLVRLAVERLEASA